MSTAGLFSVLGQVAMVTGASRGIGRAVALGLSDAGATIALVARDGVALEHVAAEIRSSGREATTFPGDVSLHSQVDALVAAIVDKFGQIDILVNAAGVSPVYTRAEDTDEATWQAIIDTNLTGTFRVCQAVGRHMIEAGRGSIVNVSSIGADVGLSRLVAYCSSKGGVSALTRVLAVEWASQGVRVNAVAPGFIETDLTRGLMDNKKLNLSIVDQAPLRRMGDVSEVVGPVVFLASDAASYVTGHSLLVDGGWTAR